MVGYSRQISQYSGPSEYQRPLSTEATLPKLAKNVAAPAINGLTSPSCQTGHPSNVATISILANRVALLEGDHCIKFLCGGGSQICHAIRR